MHGWPLALSVNGVVSLATTMALWTVLTSVRSNQKMITEMLFWKYCVLLTFAHLLYHFSRTELNRLSGTLPTEINRLQSLQFLLLESGTLTGTIPTQVGDIRTLQVIDLNFNLLRGSIPNSLYFLNNLEQLDLNNNQLAGPISTRIGRLTKLDFFQIENNAFTGTVPTEMGLLSLLRTCILDNCSHPLTWNPPYSYPLLISFVPTELATMENNRLSGTMPAEVCQNSLEVLTVDCLGAPNRPSPPLVLCDCCTICL
jgi:hypothetical protein